MHLAARRRQIHAKGRTMTLRRRTSVGGAPVAVTLLGFPKSYRPEQLMGGIQQGDQNVSILNDEIAAAAWPGPPRLPDEMVIDGLVWVVQGAMSIYEGKLLLGFDVWVRGGR